MSGAFRVLTTPAFEREFRKNAKRNRELIRALKDAVVVLQKDPHNRGGQHQIKKLAGVKQGEGQWRLRCRDYRLRYDIFANEVVLHSFRHRREAYSDT
jgi:mRNA-degrading endonuclease RelE of RelBE toxin-antitoxin system